MGFNINEMRSKLKFGGARPSLFQVQISRPSGLIEGLNTSALLMAPFMVKATDIPDSNISAIPVSYFGRTIKVAGTRSFADWSVNVINDETFDLRNEMEKWSNGINQHVANLQQTQSPNPNNYKGVASVIQYGKDGTKIREYTVDGIFPVSVGSIGLSWDNGDTIEEFPVTFSIDWWTIVNGVTGGYNVGAATAAGIS